MNDLLQWMCIGALTLVVYATAIHREKPRKPPKPTWTDILSTMDEEERKRLEDWPDGDNRK
jgi:hypothetical protein